MKYAIDIHGTLACRRENGTVGPSTLFPLLKPLMAALMEKGERVAILSGPTQSIIAEEVASLGLVAGTHYHRLLSVVDFLRESGAEMWEKPPGSGHWWTEPEVWNNAKGQMAEHYSIDIIIDDQPEYQAGMPDTTAFVLVEASLLEKVPKLEDDLESALRVAAWADMFGVVRPQHRAPFVRKRRMERVRELMAERGWEDDPEEPTEEEIAGMQALIQDKVCPACEGSGRFPTRDGGEESCLNCEGHGYLYEEDDAQKTEEESNEENPGCCGTPYCSHRRSPTTHSEKA